MKLIEILWQRRSDFEGVAECEFCGSYQSLKHGYSDRRFYDQVIPAIKCVSCGKRTNEVIPEGISDPGFQGGQLLKKIMTETFE